MTIVREGRVTRADKHETDYYLLPFDVPAGTRRLEVRYSYDRRSGNVLDLGVFDTRGTEFMTDGFRGWSGGARDGFVITERSATPGYLPGPILPGRWHVILGLYKIAAEGCTYRVEILLSDQEGERPHVLPRTGHAKYGPARSGPEWFKGDLQSHTHHSDAAGSVGDLATAARRRGLDFVAVTEHNTISHHAFLPQYTDADLLLIPSEEVTTYYGHANVWGLERWLDFRCRDDDDMQQVIREAHRRGLLVSVNHPKRGGPPWKFDPSLPVDCIEVWNGLWPVYCEQALTFWETELRRGRRLVAVGGSDKHQGPTDDDTDWLLLGRPTTYVYAEQLTTDAILAGIRAGHVFMSADVALPRLLLTVKTGANTVMMGDRVSSGKDAVVHCRVVDGAGTMLRLVCAQGQLCWEPIGTDDWVFEQRVNLREQGYVRAEVRTIPSFPGEGTTDCPVLALTNPIYGPAMSMD